MSLGFSISPKVHEQCVFTRHQNEARIKFENFIRTFSVIQIFYSSLNFLKWEKKKIAVRKYFVTCETVIRWCWRWTFLLSPWHIPWQSFNFHCHFHVNLFRRDEKKKSTQVVWLFSGHFSTFLCFIFHSHFCMKIKTWSGRALVNSRFSYSAPSNYSSFTCPINYHQNHASKLLNSADFWKNLPGHT